MIYKGKIKTFHNNIIVSFEFNKNNVSRIMKNFVAIIETNFEYIRRKVRIEEHKVKKIIEQKISHITKRNKNKTITSNIQQ